MLPNQELTIFLTGFIFIWLVALSFFIYRTLTHYKKLTTGSERKDFGSVLENILKDQEISSKKIEELIKRAEKIEKDGELHFQRIGLVRFNPFSETGGDQSFTLVMLDEQNSGFVLSSLHSRDATRIYAKPIKEGKPVGYQLSKEEAEAIQKARKN